VTPINLYHRSMDWDTASGGRLPIQSGDRRAALDALPVGSTFSLSLAPELTVSGPSCSKSCSRARTRARIDAVSGSACNGEQFRLAGFVELIQSER